jgi:hypothetical protein
MIAKNEIEKKEKIRNARYVRQSVRDIYLGKNKRAPMDPCVYFDLQNGEITVESSLAVHDEDAMEIGRVEDMFYWLGADQPAASFCVQNWIGLYDQIYDAAKEAFEM